MPRRPRLATGGIAYHVLNRWVSRLPLFEKPADYRAFEKILGESIERTNIRIAAYCLMPNHWHLLLWPREDGELSEVMRRITVTVQTDEHFLTVARYVERNAVRAGLVGRAEYWQWSSLWRLSRENEKSCEILSQWPMERPKDWIQFVNEPERESDLEDMRSSAQRGRPYGSEDWMIKTPGKS